MIAVDNMIIAWGLSATTDPAHAELAARARTFFTNLTEDVLVPAPVLAEFLVEVPLERHHGVLNALRRSFRIAPLDLPAATKAAEVTIRNFERVRGASPGTPGLRQALKVDALVLGVALVHGASSIMSHDDRLAKMAEGFPIKVVELPPIPTSQRELGSWE